jgi:TPR repeat protein
MKLLPYLSLMINLVTVSTAMDRPLTPPNLAHAIQANILKKDFSTNSHDLNESLTTLRETAIKGLYEETSKDNSINFLTNLVLTAQDSNAMMALADYFFEAEGTIERAIPLYNSAVRQNKTRAMFKLSKIYLMDSYKEVNLAHNLLLLGTELNDDICRCALAQHYLDGTFGLPNPQKALKLFYQSAINNFDLGITQSAVLLNSTHIFTKPDPVHAYELVIKRVETDNRARILATDLQKSAAVQLYTNHHYLKLAEAYMIGKILPVRVHRAKYFLNLAYKNHQISKAELNYYNKLIHSQQPRQSWSQPTLLDKILNTLF